MPSGRGFISSKYGNNSATTSSKGKSTDNSVSGSTIVSPPPPPKVASPSDTHPLNLSGSASPVGPTVHGYGGSIDEDDIVIAVMGLTGAGKSSFVNKAAGRNEAVIGHGLISQTRAVHPVRCPHPNGRRDVVLVDTPGFGDTYLSDAQILKIIANWLKTTYQNNILLAGILYLHRISDVRMAGTPLRNLHMFQDLCGNEYLKNVVFVTTMWDKLEDQSVGSKREEELLSNFWKGMIDLGSRTHRFHGTRESAWEIINCLDSEGSHQRRIPLQIQREMVDRMLPLHERAPATTLLHHLVQLAKDFKKVWEKMRNGTRRTVAPRISTNGRRRNVVLTRPSTIMSSEPSSFVVSSMDTASFSTNDSRYPPSPTEAISPGCVTASHRDTLLATITGLRLAYQVADMASIPILRGMIGTVLHIAQLIQGMGGAHHAISRVIETSGWLLEEITQYVTETPLSKDMKRTLRSFQRELNNLQRVVTKTKERGPIARFFLHDADIQVITACTTSIKAIYDQLEGKLARDNSQAIARLEEQLMALRNSTTLRQCHCGMSVVPEEPQENGHQSMIMNQS